MVRRVQRGETVSLFAIETRLAVARVLPGAGIDRCDASFVLWILFFHFSYDSHSSDERGAEQHDGSTTDASPASDEPTATGPPPPPPSPSPPPPSPQPPSPSPSPPPRPPPPSPAPTQSCSGYATITDPSREIIAPGGSGYDNATTFGGGTYRFMDGVFNYLPETSVGPNLSCGGVATG